MQVDSLNPVLYVPGTQRLKLKCAEGVSSFAFNFNLRRYIVWMCAWSRDGARLASASSDETARVWNPYTGVELARLVGHAASVFACAWSPDGTRLATASRDRTARVWQGLTLVHFSPQRKHFSYV